MMKICNVCKESKPLDLFSPNKRTSTGKQGRCKPCIAAIMRERRAANPEAHRASIKRSTERHYEKKLERNNAYRAKNPDKVKQWKKKDREINKARILADNAKRRSFFAGETSPQIKQLYALRDFYRSMSLGEEFHVDHIIPLSRGGLHSFENLQVIPAICNLRKGATILGGVYK